MRVTHEVTNQVPPLIDYDAADYPPILEALQREGAHHALDEIHRVGRLAGGAEAQALGDLAEAHPRFCGPTTATATGSTKSSTTPPTTN